MGGFQNKLLVDFKVQEEGHNLLLKLEMQKKRLVQNWNRKITHMCSKTSKLVFKSLVVRINVCDGSLWKLMTEASIVILLNYYLTSMCSKNWYRTLTHVKLLFILKLLHPNIFYRHLLLKNYIYPIIVNQYKLLCFHYRKTGHLIWIHYTLKTLPDQVYK